MYFWKYSHFQSEKYGGSGWDTFSWSNFINHHWDFFCLTKWHPGTSGIPTMLEIAVEINFHAWHGFKTTIVVLPADSEAL